jgi:SpoVK/Ycf46/Vps4 family AAA+-type ATPase
VTKLFSQARANRPSVVFIDEIDALLRRRNAGSSANWEERVVSQFLRELDGLISGEGVLLVGATNRLDTIDEAITGRRLVPVRIDLPDREGRTQLLKLLLKDVKVARDVDVAKLAAIAEGLSGADLKRLRDAAGTKALARAARDMKKTNGSKSSSGGNAATRVQVTMADFEAALNAIRNHTSLAHV